MPFENDNIPVAAIACDKPCRPDAFEEGLLRRERLARVELVEAQTLAQQLENQRTLIGLFGQLGMEDKAKSILHANLLALAGAQAPQAPSARITVSSVASDMRRNLSAAEHRRAVKAATRAYREAHGEAPRDGFTEADRAVLVRAIDGLRLV